VALLIMLAALLPFVTLASETPNTDIKTKINLNSISNFFFATSALVDEPVVAIEEPIKTEEEIRNDAILSKWKLKQTEKWNALPKEQFFVNASAYTASADECDNAKGITSSGIKVQEKRTIACPPAFPFGAKIKLEGHGVFTCEDRGGAIKGNHIDIYVKTKAEAFAFGRQNLLAEIVL